MSFLALSGYFGFWMGIVKVARRIRLEILNPKHMRKSKIELLEQIWASQRYGTFFWDTLYFTKHLWVLALVFKVSRQITFLMFGLRCLTLFLKIVGTISFCGLASFQFVPVSKYLEPSLHGSIHGGPGYFLPSTNRLECLFIEICSSLSIWMRNLFGEWLQM